MTFSEMVKRIMDREGDVTPAEAREAAVRMILDGYDDREEAMEAYRAFQDREVVGHTSEGWPISPELLLHAIHLAEVRPPPLRARFGPRRR